MTNHVVVDATDCVLGRLASRIAKQALLGKEVIVIHCNKAIITGRKKFTRKEYKRKRARGWFAQKGPHFPKSPERILKRTIRGMLSHHQERGRFALKRIRCFNEHPAQHSDKKPNFKVEKTTKTKSITLRELSDTV